MKTFLDQTAEKLLSRAEAMGPRLMGDTDNDADAFDADSCAPEGTGQPVTSRPVPTPAQAIATLNDRMQAVLLRLDLLEHENAQLTARLAGGRYTRSFEEIRTTVSVLSMEAKALTQQVSELSYRVPV